MKTILTSVLLSTLICCESCQSNFETEVNSRNIENIKTRSNDKMEEKYFIVDSTLAVGVGKRINRFTAASTRTASEEKVIKNVFPYGKGRSNQPTLYIENFEDGGFGIISADKRISPILAYSEKGEFSLNDAPEIVLDWINTVSNVIAYFRENNLQPDLEIISLWNSAECPEDAKKTINCSDVDHTSQIQKGPYLKSKWDQGSGTLNQNADYNKYCPTGCPTGCSAIAIGQVMRYWQYPTNYNWNEMSYNFPTDATARFLAELGDKNHLNINYSPSGSSAKNTIYDNVLRDYGYSASREIYNYSKVKDELYAGRPVLLSGKNSNGKSAHVWVCDGIQIFNNVTYSSSLMHMNWGWGGDHDGYYQVNNWSFTDNNQQVVEYAPNWLHRMIINIKPK